MILDIDRLAGNSLPTGLKTFRPQPPEVLVLRTESPTRTAPPTRSLQRQREIALDEAYRDCSAPDWDGYGAAPANELSMSWAKQVLAALPRRLGVPEIAFEPDGDAGLECSLGPNKALSISIGCNGELRYAVRLDAATVIGTGVFADSLPKRLVEATEDLIG